MPADLPKLIKLCENDFAYFNRHAKRLNLPATLITAANPLGKTRKSGERRLFADKIAEKRAQGESNHRQFVAHILSHVYPKLKINNIETRVSNYLGKYQFMGTIFYLLEHCKTDPTCLGTNSFALSDDAIECQRKLSGILSNPHSREAKKLLEEQVDLMFYMNPAGIMAEPFLISTKRKVPIRVAGKIPYKMLEELVKKHGKQGLTDYKSMAMLRHGLINDIYCMQIVNISPAESLHVYERINAIKDVRIIKPENFREISSKNYQLYTGIHLDVVWEGRENVPPKHPYSNKYEIILMDINEFITANLGERSYFARSSIQKEQIVLPQMQSGNFKTIRLKDAPLNWKNEIQSRILDVYGK